MRSEGLDIGPATISACDFHLVVISHDGQGYVRNRGPSSYNSEVKKILVRAPQWLGDAVVSTAFIDRLKMREPEAQVSVLCTAALVPLFQPHPSVNEAIALPYPAGNVFDAARKIRAAAFDEVYVLPRSFRSALEAALARIPRRIGYSGDLRRAMLTEVHPYDEKRLYAHRYLALIGEETLPATSIATFFPTEKPASSLYDGLKKPWLGVAPVSIASSRTWFADRFAQTAKRWQKTRGGSVILFGSAKERAAVQAVADGLGGIAVNTAGEVSLPELGWVIKQCDFFLGNDSGLMHVAAVFKIPGVIIFGASDPTNALPPWGRLIALQNKTLSCVPCLRNHCVRIGETHLECLKTISTDAAFSTLN